MQPSPMAETSSPRLPSLRVFIASLLYPKVERALSVVLPRDPPVFLGVRRLHDQLSAGQLEEARQVLADQAPDQRTLDVKREGGASVRRSRIGQTWPRSPPWAYCTGPEDAPACGFRYMTWTDMRPSRVKTSMPRAVRAVNGTVCSLLLEPEEPPGSDERGLPVIVDRASWLRTASSPRASPWRRARWPRQDESSFFMCRLLVASAGRPHLPRTSSNTFLAIATAVLAVGQPA